MSVQTLSSAIKNAVNQRLYNESRAKRGFIKDGVFLAGSNSFPFKLAVDCPLNKRVWAQLDKHGNAIIIGA